MSKNKIMNLDDMFDEDIRIVDIEIKNLIPFHSHPFPLYQGERLENMILSIRNLGVMVPIIIQPKNNSDYEILSGHNRVAAAKCCGLEKVPSVIKEGLTENEAILIVTETNTMQRSFEDLSHSEKATIIATRHKIMTSEGFNNKLISDIERISYSDKTKKVSTIAPVGTKIRTNEKIGETYNLSRNSVARYLRISKLNNDLQVLIDSQLSIRAAVDLSYLTDEEQIKLATLLKECGIKVDMTTAKNLRNKSQNGMLRCENIAEEILGKTNYQKPKLMLNDFHLDPKIIEKYFSSEITSKEIEKIIDRALNIFFSAK